jgi:hypothetical protein
LPIWQASFWQQPSGQLVASQRQVLSMQRSPAAQTGLEPQRHSPFEQVLALPVGQGRQAWPADPQRSKLGLTQAPPTSQQPLGQFVGLQGSGPVHLASRQTWPFTQVPPQAPQFAGSFCRSTHCPPQQVCPVPQAGPPPQRHSPLVQVWPAPHDRPQSPQLLGSLSTRVQAWSPVDVLQHLSGEVQMHWWMTQKHASGSRSAPSGHLSRQAPLQQSWVPGQETLQPPQLLRSLSTPRH